MKFRHFLPVRRHRAVLPQRLLGDHQPRQSHQAVLLRQGCRSPLVAMFMFFLALFMMGPVLIDAGAKTSACAT